MSETIAIFGYGTIGRLVATTLLSRGGNVRIVQRTRPAALPAGASFMQCDVLNADAVRRAVRGVSQVLLAVSFPYDARVWRTAWPATMTNLLAACAETDARIVFIDNLYQLGPQTEPRREDMPLSGVGQKPAILSEVTRLWMAARGRVRLAALRCSDFYGPGVTVSHLGAAGFGRIAHGRPALLLVPPDTAHDFAYVPDIARAAVTLLDAPDDAIGRHGMLMAVPLPLLRALGLVWRFAQEVADVGFTFDRPYVVDASRFTNRFWSDVTPFEVGAAATIRSFLPQHAR
ncbi:MAG: NAD-dependent epimerase/dehydratase family protein [Janthinobacterium lividum]